MISMMMMMAISMVENMMIWWFLLLIRMIVDDCDSDDDDHGDVDDSYGYDGMMIVLDIVVVCGIVWLVVVVYVWIICAL